MLSQEELSKLYTGIDVIGDIAVLKIPDTLLEKKYIIAEALLNNMKNLKTVLRQLTPVEGEYRVRQMELLVGEDRCLTIHKEYGCVYKVNLQKVFFSPRLSTERMRIAKEVSVGETVINMFAGVGAFSILIAKKQLQCKVYSIDINPEAHILALENVKLNKVGDRVVTILGDARDIINKQLRKSANRVLMPLPEKAVTYLDYAVESLKAEGGIIHYYTHVYSPLGENPLTKAEKEISSNILYPYKILFSKVVREVGPRLSQVVIDVYIHP